MISKHLQSKSPESAIPRSTDLKHVDHNNESSSSTNFPPSPTRAEDSTSSNATPPNQNCPPEIGKSERRLSLFAAVASALAAICAAFAAWEAVEVSRLQYEGEIKRIKFDFHKMNDHWDIRVAQLTGQSFDLESVFVEPTFIDDKTHVISVGQGQSMNATVRPDSVNSTRPYPIYEIRNVKNNICRGATCDGKKIDELKIVYKINNIEKTEIIK